MSKLKAYLQSIFSKSENKPTQVPFLHEVFDPEVDIDIDAYARWQSHSRTSLLKKRLAQAFFDFKVHQKSSDHSFEFWDTPLSKGFSVFNNENFPIERADFLFFQYDLYQHLYRENYRLNLADIQSRQKSEWIESLRRMYLKPSIFLRSGKKAIQLYGNIHLEYFERDDHPYMFRLLANAYSDQNFHKAKEFDELIELFTS